MTVSTTELCNRLAPLGHHPDLRIKDWGGGAPLNCSCCGKTIAQSYQVAAEIKWRVTDDGKRECEHGVAL